MPAAMSRLLAHRRGSYRGTSPIINSAPPGPYSRLMPTGPTIVLGGWRFLLSEVPLYRRVPAALSRPLAHRRGSHSLTHTLSLSHTHKHTLYLAHTLSLWSSVAPARTPAGFTLSHTRSLSRTHTHTHTHTHTYTHSLAHTLSLTHTHTLSLSHTLAHRRGSHMATAGCPVGI